MYIHSVYIADDFGIQSFFKSESNDSIAISLLVSLETISFNF